MDTILTCDNGISAAEQIALARDLGMTVIVTDHHDIPERGIPDCAAVVNPKQADCPYPFKGLCGAVVAFKLVQAMYQKRGLPREEASAFLEYAALATVADVMELKGENRILVKEGLKRLRQTDSPGLNALMEAAGIRKEGAVLLSSGLRHRALPECQRQDCRLLFSPCGCFSAGIPVRRRSWPSG